ncbi:hypothetical protein ABIE41_000192 [Bosea sp. OAE506]|uniref:hypothetical protein n=1 Tax=Bosea sp. OAE506 TaxID=2663870 RepID=UPI00178B408F
MSDLAALRRLTIIGERVMKRAESEGVSVIDAQDDPLLRCYAATGLLGAALGELQGSVARQVAIETIQAALTSVEGLDS